MSAIGSLVSTPQQVTTSSSSAVGAVSADGVREEDQRGHNTPVTGTEKPAESHLSQEQFDALIDITA